MAPNSNHFLKESSYLTALKSSIWLLGIAVGLLNVASQGMAVVMAGFSSAIALTHLLVTALFLIAWFCLKPASVVMERATIQNPNSTL
ncbi:MAG: hypothetical protein SFY66_20280 [Oculatellaceae cyanobacterium bins.114]|nr:hypothetical protein [Oculatellaceae cyanobacterium bins.114]